jgi:hypothetical protein
MGRVFNSRSGCMYAICFCCYEAKQPNIKLETRPKQLLGSLLLAFALPVFVQCLWSECMTESDVSTIENEYN